MTWHQNCFKIVFCNLPDAVEKGKHNLIQEKQKIFQFNFNHLYRKQSKFKPKKKILIPVNIFPVRRFLNEPEITTMKNFTKIYKILVRCLEVSVDKDERTDEWTDGRIQKLIVIPTLYVNIAVYNNNNIF